MGLISFWLSYSFQSHIKLPISWEFGGEGGQVTGWGPGRAQIVTGWGLGGNQVASWSEPGVVNNVIYNDTVRVPGKTINGTLSVRPK